MPIFGLHVLCPAEIARRTAHHGMYLEAGRAVSRQLPALTARAMVATADGRFTATGEGWQVVGGMVEPELCRDESPITAIVSMNPVYRGVNFSDHVLGFHTHLRQGIWQVCTAYAPTGEVVHVPFTVRIQFMEAAGSDVDSAGVVSEEYGGDTGIIQLTP